MLYVAHEYQNRSTDFILVNRKCGLFLKMGLGKTVATLTAIDELMYNRFDISRVLVIAPLRVAEDTWSSEAEKWDHLKHLKISKVLGTAKQRIKALRQVADIYIVNRDNTKWLFSQDIPDFDMIVVDELSSFKNPKSNRFKVLRKVKCDRFVGLTGTPAPNGLIDLWSQVFLMDRGARLGKTLTSYRQKYFYPGYYKWVLQAGADEAIYDKLADICLSMKTEDWLQLPDRIDNIVNVKLPRSVKELYEKLESELVLELQSSDVVASNAAVLCGKLLQFCNGAVYDEAGGVALIHDEKLKALEDIIEEAQGRSVLVFYSFKHDLERLKKYGKQLKTSKDIEDWNTGKIPVMVCHPASAGHGLNLQEGGSIIVWFGLTWSLELYQQANARLHRQGQTEKVIVHHILAAGTIEHRVYKSLIAKENVQDGLFRALKA